MKVTMTKGNSPFKPNAKQNLNQFKREIIELNRYINYESKDISVEEFATRCANGYAWRAGIFKEIDGKTRFKDEYVESVSCIALDFDDTKANPEKVIAYAESVGIPANFYYYSYSQNPELIEESENQTVYSENINLKENNWWKAAYKDYFNFRVVWCFDEPIEPKKHMEVYETLVNYTFAAFDGIDTTTKNPQQLFYGGNFSAVIINPEPTSLAALGWQAIVKKSAEGVINKTVHRQTKAGAKEWEELDIPEAITINNKWMEQLRPHCNLLDKWMNQEYLDYNQRLTLWSNLRFLKYPSYSRTVIKDLMSYYKPEVWEGHSFSEEELKRKFRDTKLKPAPIVFYHGVSMTAVEFFNDYHDGAINPQLDLQTLEELDTWMDENTSKLLDNKEFIYFQSQTASGKTERIINNLVNRSFNLDKEIYAVPTHNLAKEFEERLRAADPDIPIYRVPETKYTPSDLLLLRLGLPATIKDQKRAEVLLKLFDEETHGVFIITHSLLVRLGGRIPASRIIVDENIEEALIQNIKISIPKLSVLEAYVSKKETSKYIFYLIDQARECEEGTELPNVFNEILEDFDLERYLDDAGDSTYLIDGLYSIPHAECLKVSTENGRKCLRALIKSEAITGAISNNIPVKLFTATPMSQRLKNYYGLDFKVVQAPLAKNQGKEIQYRGISGARGISKGLGIEREKFEKYNKYIQTKLTPKQIAKSHVISFKGSKDLWQEKEYQTVILDGKEIHLTNNAGLDFLKGKDLIIVGKFDKPDEFYYDLWSDIGDGSFPRRQNRRIFHNGVWQTLYLWDKEELRNEQLQYMEYATQQAIGRARTLRTDATVYLFSNYVPLGVDEIYD